MSSAHLWLTLGKKLAVIAGASTALVSLLAHTTLLTASMRGAVALFAVLVIVRLGNTILSRGGPGA